MGSRSPSTDPAELVRTWPLPFGATLGSTIREVGLFLEIRARLRLATRKAVSIKRHELTLRLPQGSTRRSRRLVGLIGTALGEIETTPLLPREVEDILAISSTERHRWLKDGRLPSAGTRTVNLRGRARSITFHVFDPRLVEDTADRGRAAAGRPCRNGQWRAVSRPCRGRLELLERPSEAGGQFVPGAR